ncbi:MAG: VOC family protein [Chloroflexota bacterium]
MKARYVHTSLVARDWRRLAQFYIDVFGCVMIPPERDLSGEWLSDATGVPFARIRGAHLQLPGYAECGPSLEVFQYNQVIDAPAPVANRQGLAHLAFEVEDVHATLEEVVSAGGASLGAIVTRTIEGVGVLTFCYCTDPEGNIIELQHWSGHSASP